MRSFSIAKIATGIGTAGLLFCLAAGAAYAQPGRRPGGHPGPAPHPAGGGAPHFTAPHVAAPHVAAPHFAPHISAAPHFTPHVSVARHFTPHINLGRRATGIAHFAHPRVSHFAAHINHVRPHLGTAHVRPSVVHGTGGTATVHNATPNVGRGAATVHTAATGVTGRTDPRNFAAHRNLAGDPAFRPFLGHGWHPHRHLGWIGPLFWPYAYGDFFYYALWPYEYAYYDPFWYYGYGDIYEGIFSPYNYDEYVRGPSAPARMTALTQSVAQSCTNEAAEVTGWPIDQIQATLSPNARQSALLDDLGNAIVKASGVIKSHCPTTLAFTPTDRLADMQERLEGLVQAVNMVEPPLAKFYDSLSDEQKARFNDIGAPGGQAPAQGKQAAQNPQAECGENVMAFPADRIDRIVQPNDAQRAKLRALQAANAKAADLIKAACPSELPSTPPDRLAAEGKRLQAMLAAVQTLRPALDDFYTSLSDEQKARFNTLGRQLFAQR